MDVTNVGEIGLYDGQQVAVDVVTTLVVVGVLIADQVSPTLMRPFRPWSWRRRLFNPSTMLLRNVSTASEFSIMSGNSSMMAFAVSSGVDCCSMMWARLVAAKRGTVMPPRISEARVAMSSPERKISVNSNTAMSLVDSGNVISGFGAPLTGGSWPGSPTTISGTFNVFAAETSSCDWSSSTIEYSSTMM